MVAARAVIIHNNIVGRYWGRYYNFTTMFVAAGAVILLSNIVGRHWSPYYTQQQFWSLQEPLKC